VNVHVHVEDAIEGELDTKSISNSVFDSPSPPSSVPILQPVSVPSLPLSIVLVSPVCGEGISISALHHLHSSTGALECTVQYSAPM
jgi:hypothetical protein